MTTISENSLRLFHKTAQDIPAYKKFLAAAGIKPETIKTTEDFKNLPLTSKKNYLLTNKLDDLIRHDSQNPQVYCSTSGSTGEPYYFPRDDRLSWQYSFLLEDFLKNSSSGKGSTLVLIGFGMGVWIGGIITLRALEIAGQRLDSPLSILPTGYNKTEIFKALRKLSPNFDQTVIVGYPPFIKELVDEAPSEGIELKRLNIRLLFAAEAFTETFRNYVCEKAGIKNPIVDTLNVYGTADMGAMAYETPISILVRRIALENPLLFRDVFGQIEKTPTLAQFNPEFIEFEAVDGELVLTGDAALPMVRYAVGDHGGVIEYDAIVKLIKKYGVSLDAEAKKAGITSMIKKLPFVFVYERTDLSTTLHGMIIYPEFVKEGLLQPKLTPYFTERFTILTKHDIYHNQFLQINLELRKNVEPSKKLEDQVLRAITKSLIEKSSEFAEVSRNPASDKLLQVVLWENGHPRYFAPGIKQKWIEKP